MFEYAIIVQCRLGSRRLADKMLRCLVEGLTVADILFTRLSTFADRLNKNWTIYIAIPQEKQQAPMVNLLQKYPKLKLYKGETSNVLKRFQALVMSNYQDTRDLYVIRICGDNPFVDLQPIKKAVQMCEDRRLDYFQPYANNTPSILTGHGLAYEVLKGTRLLELTTKMPEAEHVTPDFYSDWQIHSNRIRNLDFDKIYSGFSADIRLTLDYDYDLDLLRAVFDKYMRYCLGPCTAELVNKLGGDMKLRQVMRYNASMSMPKA